MGGSQLWPQVEWVVELVVTSRVKRPGKSIQKPVGMWWQCLEAWF